MRFISVLSKFLMFTAACLTSLSVLSEPIQASVTFEEIIRSSSDPLTGKKRYYQVPGLNNNGGVVFSYIDRTPAVQDPTGSGLLQWDKEGSVRSIDYLLEPYDLKPGARLDINDDGDIAILAQRDGFIENSVFRISDGSVQEVFGPNSLEGYQDTEWFSLNNRGEIVLYTSDSQQYNEAIYLAKANEIATPIFQEALSPDLQLFRPTPVINDQGNIYFTGRNSEGGVILVSENGLAPTVFLQGNDALSITSFQDGIAANNNDEVAFLAKRNEVSSYFIVNSGGQVEEVISGNNAYLGWSLLEFGAAPGFNDSGELVFGASFPDPTSSNGNVTGYYKGLDVENDAIVNLYTPFESDVPVRISGYSYGLLNNSGQIAFSVEFQIGGVPEWRYGGLSR